MSSNHQQLGADEWNQLQRELNLGMSLRAPASELERSPSTLSRKYRRGWMECSYDVVSERKAALARRHPVARKLVPGNVLTEQVTTAILEQKWSLEQVPGKLRLEYPEDQSQQVNQ